MGQTVTDVNTANKTSDGNLITKIGTAFDSVGRNIVNAVNNNTEAIVTVTSEAASAQIDAIADAADSQINANRTTFSAGGWKGGYEYVDTIQF